MNRFLSLITISLSSLVYSQTPGGVFGEDLWYKTDANTVANEQYMDYGPNEYLISHHNSITANLFNFNHSLNFQGGYLSFPYSVEDMKVATIFTVYISNENENSSLIHSEWMSGIDDGNGNNEKQFFYTTDKLVKEDFTLGYPEEGEVANALVNTLNWFDFNSNYINNSTGTGGESNVFIGKANAQALAFKGSIPEFIIYRKALSREERQRVESYLAIKYGITLIHDVHYFNSDYEIIWDRHNNSVFGNRIIAIGRDDISGLYQKQTTSSHSLNKEIILNAGEFTENNELNESAFGNNNFIFVGDNDGALTLYNNNDDDDDDDDENIGDWKLYRMNRVWLTHPYGVTCGEIETELRYNAADLFDKIHQDYDEEYWDDITIWLLIDRTADELVESTFDLNECEAYMYDSVEDDHIVYLNQKWDEDTSGFDQFTFAVGPKMLVEVTLQEMECFDEEGNIDVQITFGEPNFDFHLFNQDLTYDETVTDWTTRNIAFEDLPNGWYTLDVTDDTGYVRTLIFDVSPTAGMYIDFEDQYIVPMDGSVVLDASENVDPNITVTYEWFRNGNVVTTTPGHLMPLEKPGIYRVVLTNENGCQVEDTTEVIEQGTQPRSNQEETLDDLLAQETIIIYPNPTQINNSFTVEINLLEEQDAQIQIYDFAGSLIHNETLKNSSNYQWNHRILQSGSYLISVITKNKKLTKKLLVK